MIWVPGVMVVPGGGGYIPPRTGLSFFIGSTGLQTTGEKLKARFRIRIDVMRIRIRIRIQHFF
jgi:hypothetical protein